MFSIQQWAQWISKGSASIPYYLLENYKKLTLTETEMMLIIHIHAFQSKGVPFPSIEQLQERMSCSTNQISHMLNRLLKEHLIDIESSVDQDGCLFEAYSLNPLWEKLVITLTEYTAEDEVAAGADDTLSWPSDTDGTNDPKQLEGEIYHRFEQEFGRPLSPIECETIGIWIDDDGYDPSIIFQALREAVISNKLSFRYIDRILMEWEKKGIKSPEQAREQAQQFRKGQTNLSQSRKKSQPVEYEFYNWLEK